MKKTIITVLALTFFVITAGAFNANFKTVPDFFYNVTSTDQGYKSISFTPKSTPLVKWDYVSEGLALRNRTWEKWDNLIIEDQVQNISIPMWAQRPYCLLEVNF